VLDSARAILARGPDLLYPPFLIYPTVATGRRHSSTNVEGSSLRPAAPTAAGLAPGRHDEHRDAGVVSIDAIKEANQASLGNMRN
jgi:hypothetical protein